MGIISGVTTNPSLFSKNNDKDFLRIVGEICDIDPRLDVSIQAPAQNSEQMLEQARKILKISENITIKLPITESGLKACSALAKDGIRVNMTLCFSACQAIAARSAGAKYISAFMGRVDDISASGMNLISEISKILNTQGAASNQAYSKILAASIRSPLHVKQAALAGADIATISAKILTQMLEHPLTDKGVEKFTSDWQKTGFNI